MVFPIMFQTKLLNKIPKVIKKYVKFSYLLVLLSGVYNEMSFLEQMMLKLKILGQAKMGLQSDGEDYAQVVVQGLPLLKGFS